jgi:hypothetical protein
MNSHWGETVHWSPDNTVEISMSCQGLDPTEVTEIWSPFFDWVKARPNDFAIVSPLGAGAGDSRRAWDSTQPWFAHDTREGAPAYHAWNKGNEGECGALLYGYDSLWLSARLLQEDRRKDLNEALFAASRHAMVRFHTGKALAGAPPEVLAAVRQTSTHPAVLDAFTLVIIADGDETPAYPGMARPPVDLARARKGAHDIDLAMAELRKVAPHAGSYVNEGNYFNPVWQEDFWGENYSRLRAIKAKFDPDGLFFVHHGVGSEDWSADGFTRQASPT